MQTISDLLHSLIESSKERIKTPITGAFICSFFIYNWRPIFLLLFSDTNIEYKIAMIDYEYCTLGTILWPLGLAFFYTIMVPSIMLVVDELLIPINKRRISSKYNRKFFEAERETELKNIISGNRDHQELIDRIKFLEESNIQRANADKNTIESLNLKLNDSNELVQDLQNTLNNFNLTHDGNDNSSNLAEFYNNLSEKNKISIFNFANNPETQFSDLPLTLQNLLTAKDYFKKNNTGNWALTPLGMDLVDSLKIHRRQP
ncbi:MULTISPECIES: hypothetical protein [Flavobacterium]|uniref:hypothetical protein n=1 Tax=Flavobacterium TaxID=237 RepID=UPI0011821261|nr:MULTISPECIES: hypothetical protein [Flavobacterium]MCR4030400.1 hypothetical protein [Flavobacterium panacis]